MAGLLTHLHGDHADVAALTRALRSIARELGVAARVLEPGEKLRLQPRSTQSEP